MTDQEDRTMRKVLTIGPSLKTRGGMGSVLNAYREFTPGFRHLATNSIHGSLAGAFNATIALMRMPIERLRGRSILHIHSASGKSFTRKTIFIHWGRILGYKIIFHCHGGASKQYFLRLGIPKAKRILSKASAIIALSNSWKEYFENTFGFSNVTVVSNPVRLPANPQMPMPDEPINLLFLGYISDNKGIFEFIDTIKRNADRWRGHVQLKIGGNGETERLINEINELGIQDMVEFIGWASGPIKEMAFASSHILILPSHNEGLPISVLEGMAYGKAIIATPVGGIPELVETNKNGILVPPGNKKAFARAVDTYIQNPGLIQTHGHESRLRATPFSFEASATKLAELYQSLL